MNISEITREFLSIVIQLRVFHWQTESFSQHKAFGSAYDSLNESTDKFIETMIGTYGRPVEIEPLTVADLSETSLNTLLENATSFLQGLTDELDLREDSDLLNMRDEMLGTVNHLKYLLTLS